MGDAALAPGVWGTSSPAASETQQPTFPTSLFLHKHAVPPGSPCDLLRLRPLHPGPSHFRRLNSAPRGSLRHPTADLGPCPPRLAGFLPWSPVAPQAHGISVGSHSAVRCQRGLPGLGQRPPEPCADHPGLHLSVSPGFISFRHC